MEEAEENPVKEPLLLEQTQTQTQSQTVPSNSMTIATETEHGIPTTSTSDTVTVTATATVTVIQTSEERRSEYCELRALTKRLEDDEKQAKRRTKQAAEQGATATTAAS